MLAFAAGAAAQDARRAAPPDAGAIIARYVDALGGREAIASKTSRTIDGRVEIPDQELRGTVRLQAASPNLLVVTLDLEGVGTIKQGFDGTVAWALHPTQGPMFFEGKVAQQFRDRADFHEVLHYDRRYRQIELVGRSEFDDRDTYEVRCVTPNGDAHSEFFDIRTGLRIGVKGTVEGPGGPVPTTTTFSDYRTFDGVAVPMHQQTLQMGAWQVTTYESVSFAPIDRAVFEPPPSVKLLLEKRAEQSDEAEETSVTSAGGGGGE